MPAFPSMVANIVYIGSRPKAMTSWNAVPTVEDVRANQNLNCWLARRKVAPETFVQLVVERSSKTSSGVKPLTSLVVKPPTPALTGFNFPTPNPKTGFNFPTPNPKTGFNFASPKTGFDSGSGWGHKPGYASKFPSLTPNDASSKQFPARKEASIQQRLGWLAENSPSPREANNDNWHAGGSTPAPVNTSNPSLRAIQVNTFVCSLFLKKRTCFSWRLILHSFRKQSLSLL